MHPRQAALKNASTRFRDTEAQRGSRLRARILHATFAPMTFSKSICLALVGGLAAAGCGGSGDATDSGVADTGATDGGGMTDGGTCNDPDSAVFDLGTPPAGNCPPPMSPDPMNQMGSCCWRQNNMSQLTAPTFRLAALQITSPGGTLSSALVRGLLQQGFDAETFNWLIQLTGVPTTGSGTAMLKTGYGIRAADGSFTYQMGGAPAPGDPNRWDPVMAMANVNGEVVTSTPYNGLITVPSFDSMSTMVPPPLLIEFPISNLELLALPMSEMRSCVGVRSLDTWAVGGGGRLSAFIRVSEAKPRPLNYSTLHTTLCGVIAGSLTNAAYCDAPQAGWTTKPDSICTTTSCMQNTCATTVCDPLTDNPDGTTIGAGGKPGCNAWHLLGSFVAQGVTVH